jgi:hypothetical protein
MTNLTVIPEYTETALALADLKTKYAAVVFDVSTGKGMDIAKAARAELRGYRVALENKRKEIKEPALTRCREIDSEAKRITNELEALEGPIDATIKAEEQRKEREKAAKEAAEAERLRIQTEWFDSVKTLPLGAMGKTAAEIKAILDHAKALTADHLAADMIHAGKFTIRNTIMALRAALCARETDDERQAKIDADLAELAKRREQDEADRKAREEVAVEQARQAQAAADARDAAERKAREDAAAKERAEREKADRLAQEELTRQRAEIAEQARQAAERRLQEEKDAAIEREALAKQRAQLEAEQRELERQQIAKKIASASLIEAATAALGLLHRCGQANAVETLTLASALDREPKDKRAAA